MGIRYLLSVSVVQPSDQAAAYQLVGYLDRSPPGAGLVSDQGAAGQGWGGH